MANKHLQVEPIVSGLYSKKEAASLVVGGCHHLHSSSLGNRDTLAAVTRACLAGHPAPYQWEPKSPKTISLLSSTERHSVIRQIVDSSGLSEKRDLREKLESVVEELVSNAIYHAYVNKDGGSKYPRSLPAKLDEKERITVRFHAQESGIFVSVLDQGGILTFSRLGSSFARCYGSGESQIEDKEGGAGLGLYMVFEICTHIKIAVKPGRWTEVSCWIADSKYYDPDYFSLNFFEWR